MTIRAFLERWIGEATDPLPAGTLFPLSVSPDAKDVQLNEDGTITVTATFAYTDEETRRLFLSAIAGYLKEVKDKTGAIITVTLDKE